MSCSYYTFRCNDYYCIKKQDYVDDDTYHRYCKAYSYDECPIYRDEPSSGGCYLSSACFVAMNRSDSCEELSILRNFRDTYMNSDEYLKKDIAEYYRVAPSIVDNINLQHNYKEIYSSIYNDLICPCISHIKNKEYKEAYLLYKKMYCILKDKYYNVK